MPNLSFNKEIASLFLSNIYMYYSSFGDGVGTIVAGGGGGDYLLLLLTFCTVTVLLVLYSLRWRHFEWILVPLEREGEGNQICLYTFDNSISFPPP